MLVVYLFVHLSLVLVLVFDTCDYTGTTCVLHCEISSDDDSRKDIFLLIIIYIIVFGYSVKIMRTCLLFVQQL